MNKEELDAFLAFIPGLSVDKMVKLFVKTRAAKAAASKIFDAADAEFKLILETCENHMLSAADKAGVTGFTTPFGTTYTAETSKTQRFSILCARPATWTFSSGAYHPPTWRIT
jgi:hypothetical protein